MILRTYQYLFYHIHCWNARKDPLPNVTAFLTIGMAVVMNIVTLMALFRFFVHRDFFPDVPNSVVVAVASLTLIPQYFAAFHKGRYKQILAKYNGESRRERLRGNWIASAYVIGSFLAMIVILLATANWRST